MKMAVFALLLVSTAALAEEPAEEHKAWALKRAYQLNGNSMVRWGTIDLSREQPDSAVVKTVPVVPDQPPEPAPPVRTAPQSQARPKIRVAKNIEANVCSRHHWRKVASADGKSWHCQK